jgi:hypothetical protein
MKRLLASSIMVALAIACGGTTTDVDGGFDAQKDVAPDTSGTYACGTNQCQSGEICVHPCCGGAPPPCVPLDDGGTCPAGYTMNYCGNLATNGCVPPPCTPPPPYCSPGNQPHACTATNPSTPRDCYETCA